MTQIGLFSRTPDGFTGRLDTLTLSVGLTLVTADHNDAENAPEFRVHLGEDSDGPEVGAAWRRT
ncbi:MAG: DUF736 domain-containing protein, partial [Pseudomonadota bacterium]|nr:DUF736 domain-containing protein [Pseudomonadota bacterium]